MHTLETNLFYFSLKCIHNDFVLVLGSCPSSLPQFAHAIWTKF